MLLLHLYSDENSSKDLLHKNIYFLGFIKRKWDFSKFVQRAPFRGESVSKRIECLAYTTDETKLLVKFV